MKVEDKREYGKCVTIKDLKSGDVFEYGDEHEYRSYGKAQHCHIIKSRYRERLEDADHKKHRQGEHRNEHHQYAGACGSFSFSPEADAENEHAVTRKHDDPRRPDMMPYGILTNEHRKTGAYLKAFDPVVQSRFLSSHHNDICNYIEKRHNGLGPSRNPDPCELRYEQKECESHPDLSRICDFI